MATARDQLLRARTSAELVEALTRCGISSAEIARLGASAAAPLELLQALRDAAVDLSETLTPTGIGQWMHARNRLLGGAAPLDALSAGEVAAVRAAAASFVDGSYA